MPIDPRHPHGTVATPAGTAGRLADIERRLSAAGISGTTSATSSLSAYKFRGQDHGELDAGVSKEFSETHSMNVLGDYLVIATLIDRWEADTSFFSAGAYLCTWAIRDKQPNFFTWAISNPAAGSAHVAVRLDYLIVPM